MPPKKYALKGEPDFHRVGDEKLKSYLDLTQQLIFCYKGYSDEKVTVLKEIWKDLSVEDSDRIARSACEVLDREESSGTPTSSLRKVPKVRKSPAKRKI